MNKSDLIEHIAQQADISKAAASRALEAAIDAITEALKNGDSVSLVGFGTFVATEREARTGRNPRTGEVIPIAARRVVTFHASHKLKDLIQSENPGQST